MHASIWRFQGDPDDLLERYDRLVERMPDPDMQLHLCLRADDGIVVVDTCPSKDVYDRFIHEFQDALAGVGLPLPVIEDYPVHAAYAVERSMRSAAGVR